MLLTHALALSANQFFMQEKVPTSMCARCELNSRNWLLQLYIKNNKKTKNGWKPAFQTPSTKSDKRKRIYNMYYKYIHTTWASQKTDNIPKALFIAPPLLRVRTWKTEALTPAQHCIFTKMYIWKILRLVFSDTISPRYPRKLKSINFSTLNSYKNRRSR